jgi:hypothetical protein
MSQPATDMYCCCRCLQAKGELLKVQQELTKANNHMTINKEALAATQVSSMQIHACTQLQIST